MQPVGLQRKKDRMKRLLIFIITALDVFAVCKAETITNEMQCSYSYAEKIIINPTEANFDEKINIVIKNCLKSKNVEVHVYDKVTPQYYLYSHAIYKSNDNGIIDLSKNKPISGSYSSIDQMVYSGL